MKDPFAVHLIILNLFLILFRMLNENHIRVVLNAQRRLWAVCKFRPSYEYNEHEKSLVLDGFGFINNNKKIFKSSVLL